MTTDTPSAGVGEAAAAPEFAIRKIYVKDVSFEVPNAPAIFTGEWKPETELRLNSQARLIAEDSYEVELGLTVTVRTGGNTAYLAEIKQAGLFLAKGFGDDRMRYLLTAHCPALLFPFAREAIASLSGRGGFPALYLDPINFDAIYAQRLQQQGVNEGSVQ